MVPPHSVPRPVLFDLDDITLSYQGRPALHHFSACFRAGEMWAVLGANGSGKSTLLRVLSGELTHWEGRLVRPALPTRRIGYLGQSSLVNQDLPVTVGDVVSQGRAFDLGVGLWPAFTSKARARRQAAHAQIEIALEAMGLNPIRDKVWTHLSGGQRQRTLIARLLAQDADVLLLDEPMNSLDESSQQKLIEVLESLNAVGKTIICVLHNDDLARRHFPHRLLMKTHQKPAEDAKSRTPAEPALPNAETTPVTPV